MEVKSYKYKRGVRLLEKSPYIVSEGTETLGLSRYIFVPLKQFKGPTPLIMIEVGEEVSVGSILAKGRTCVILSPVSGNVVAIEKRPSIYGGVCDHIIIETGREETYFPLPELNEDKLTPEQILKRIFDCGIVNNDGVPLYQKLTIEEGEVIDSIVINACTDELFIDSSSSIMNTMPYEVIQGIEYLVKCIGVNVVKLAVTNSTYKRLEDFLSVLKTYDGLIRFEVARVGDNYPVGDEDILTSVLNRNRKKPKTLDKSRMIVIDVGCCFSVYQAITRGFCDDYKLITISGVGENFNEQKNVWVKVGTTIGDILNQTRQGVTDGVTKIVVGGPMRGVSVSGLECAVTKTTKGIQFMSDVATALNLETKCIGCGKCVEVCPKRLLPYRIDELSQSENYDECNKFGATECTKCGCCSYVCPAKRHLVQRIIYAKDVIEGRGGERI